MKLLLLGKEASSSHKLTLDDRRRRSILTKASQADGNPWVEGFHSALKIMSRLPFVTPTQRQVTAGALVGDAVLPALKSAVEKSDPAAAQLAEELFSRAANGEEGGSAGGNGGSSGGGGGVSRSGQGVEEAMLLALSPEAQSVLVDLGRTALKAS